MIPHEDLARRIRLGEDSRLNSSACCYPAHGSQGTEGILPTNWRVWPMDRVDA